MKQEDITMIQDYKWLKGFNYVPSYAQNDIELWRDYDPEVIERELGYAKRLGFNCVRVFLAYVVYEDQKERFLKNLLHLVRTAHAMGMKTLPVVWDSCFTEKEPLIDVSSNEWFANPGVMNLGEEFWPKGEEYCRDLVAHLQNEEGLMMWDVHNEPMITGYVGDYTGEVKQQHMDRIWTFVKHFCEYFHEIDKVNLVTVGVSTPRNLAIIGDYCDVLSFHDYAPTWKGIEKAFECALKFSQKLNKPVFCSEMCCTARANPYDVAIEMANRYHVGYILWELMIGRCFWYDRHGIVYPDGTIRDASIVAALMGFFRRRENMVDYNINTEGYAEVLLKQVAEWKAAEEKDPEAGLELVCALANLLESGQLVAEHALPTARYVALAKENVPSVEKILQTMNEWAPILQADVDVKR